MEVHLVLDFLTKMVGEMTGTLGSRVTGAKNVAIKSNSRLSLVVTTVSLEVLAMLQSKNYFLLLFSLSIFFFVLLL